MSQEKPQEKPSPPKTRRREHPTIIAENRQLTLAAIKAEEARLQAIANEREHPEADLTDQLEAEPLDVLKLLRSLVERKPEEKVQYRPLPALSAKFWLAADKPVWRIELRGSRLGPVPVGIDVCGDVVIGRGPEADLDLDEFNGYEIGVSRRHALLRPTSHHLHLLDLGSTNGTFYNLIPLPRSAIHPLKHDDLISLGQFNMTLKVIEPPKAN